jgi:type III secretion protein T
MIDTQLQPYFAQAQAVAMTLPRTATVLMVLPFFSGRLLSGTVRHSITLLLAGFISPAIGELPQLNPGWVLAIASKEVLIGLLLGLGFGTLIWAAQSVGELIDFQTGSSNAALFDPIAGHESGPTSQFLGWTVMVLFISAGGLLALISTLTDSFTLWPVADLSPRWASVLERFAVHQGEQLFTWIVKLAAPVVTVLLLLEWGLGLINRFVPQLNVFTLSQPLKSLLAHGLLLLLMGVLYTSLQDVLNPRHGVLHFLQTALG